MNQKVISGIGNYLRSDILWLSRIDPFRLVKDLTEKEIKRIYQNTRLLTWGDYHFKKAVKLKIIKEDDKLPIHYKRNFFVYDQKEDIYGNPVIKKELYEGTQKRFIYFVETIQK
jgi:formamidopyrimidine-DNA glycosylase